MPSPKKWLHKTGLSVQVGASVPDCRDINIYDGTRYQPQQVDKTTWRVEDETDEYALSDGGRRFTADRLTEGQPCDN